MKLFTDSEIKRMHDMNDYSEVIAEFGVKHDCVRAACHAVKSGKQSGGYQAGNQYRASQRDVAGNQAQAHSVSANVALVGGVVELGTNIDEAIGFEPESVWPVIAMLWDIHGYKGVYDMGVIGVWMAGLGCMVYVSGVHSYE